MADCEREQLFSITVFPRVFLSCGNPPNAGKGRPYFHLLLFGGTAPFAFSITAGSLPPGLTLGATTGVISGTPTVASGTFTFTVQMVDSSEFGPVTVECSISLCPTNAQGVV